MGKKVVKSLNRKSVLEFTDNHLDTIRSQLDDSFLSDYMSNMISKVKKLIRPRIINQLRDTNINTMRVSGKVPAEMIQYLDNSIEYVIDKVNKKDVPPSIKI